MANANVTLRVSIIDSAAGGNIAYSEIHKTGTNKFRLVNISIGRGIQPVGLFENINWATGHKWMQLELSQNDGATFTLIGASEMLSVPYALYAEKSNTPGPQGPQGPPGPQGQSDSTFFNPLYPDGTLGMTGVSRIVNYSTPYVVPTGKNFYITYASYDVSNFKTLINGIDVPYFFHYFDNQSFTILGSGDSISVPQINPYDLSISGYLIDPFVTSVNANLKDSSFVVPFNKQLFVTQCLLQKDTLTPKILINGSYMGYTIVPTLSLVLNSGDTISSTPAVLDVYLNGYLK